MKHIYLVGVFIIVALLQTTGQTIDAKIDQLLSSIEDCELSIVDANEKLEVLKLDKIQEDLKAVGFPGNDIVNHSAMVLEYSEKDEQAKWVMHMILPDIRNGAVFRTNDFRVDPKISTGTAVQEDYFLTDTLASGKVKYDGFGYDRGHLAPSADFRWSKTALSESYYYSNMSPQLADFNREKWAELEDYLRKYVLSNNTALYVVTAPLLEGKLPVIERSINKLTIPTKYAKFVYDPLNKRSIAFVLENKMEVGPLDQYAVIVDDAEKEFGLDVFPLIDAQEDKMELSEWFEALKTGDVEPIAQNTMPRGKFNTIVGMKRIGKESVVCGRVVSTRISRAGHLWLNIDKQFPNQILSVFIRKDDLANFDYDAQKYLESKQVCFEGKVEDLNGTATINVKRSKQVSMYIK